MISYLDDTAGRTIIYTIRNRRVGITFAPETEILVWNAHNDLTSLLDEILNAFRPRGTIRGDGHKPVPGFALIRVDSDFIQEHMPYVRDRLEAKTWLRQLFQSMNLNTDLIQNTFGP